MLRGRARLTQRAVAASIGVSERAVQVWEAGVGHPSAASLQRLLALYLNRGAFLAGREVAEAAAFWDAAVREAPRLNSLFDSEWFSALVHRSREAALNDSGIGSSAWVAPTRNDWGEAPSVPAFHGRLAEQQTLADWMVSSNCRVVGIVGSRKRFCFFQSAGVFPLWGRASRCANWSS